MAESPNTLKENKLKSTPAAAEIDLKSTITLHSGYSPPFRPKADALNRYGYCTSTNKHYLSLMNSKEATPILTRLAP